VTAAVPGIVLVCVDTLRADAAGPGAPPGSRRLVPSLDAAASGATAFLDATSSSSWTAPSVATLLTRLLPEHTGVLGPSRSAPPPETVTTIGETLPAVGGSTHAITAGGFVAATRGYARGFDSFSEAFALRGPGLGLETWDRRRSKDAPFFLFLHT